MKKIIRLFESICVVGALVGCSSVGSEQDLHVINELRAPDYPLVTIDPYTSAWSAADHLYDIPVQHWSGKDFPLLGVIKVDGEIYRFMGDEELEFDVIAGTSASTDWNARYTFNQPRAGWEKPEFNDLAWKEGPAAFGTANEASAKTEWDSEWIFVRRVIDINSDLKGKKVLRINLKYLKKLIMTTIIVIII